MNCEFALSKVGEMAYELDFLHAELGDIGAEFLTPQLIEYRGPNLLKFLRL